MSPPLVRPIVCPVLVGRAPHVAALYELIDEASGGTGLVALVAGEAGVGKSRLVGEAIAYATTRRCRLLLGACFQTDKAIPYSPILDLLRTRFAGRSSAAILAELGPSASLLRPLLPDLLAPSLEILYPVPQTSRRTG